MFKSLSAIEAAVADWMSKETMMFSLGDVVLGRGGDVDLSLSRLPCGFACHLHRWLGGTTGSVRT